MLLLFFFFSWINHWAVHESWLLHMITFFLLSQMFVLSWQEKAGGKIIHRAGGVVYLFRGRNYNYRTRPQYPVMLWKPAAPVYPKLIQDAPEGLTKAEADELRMKGKSLLPICKLGNHLLTFRSLFLISRLHTTWRNLKICLE